MDERQDKGVRVATIGPGASPEMRKAVIKQAAAEGSQVDWRGATLIVSRYG